MDNFRLTDEYRKKLLESAAWDKVGVVLSEARETEEAIEKEQIDEAKKKKKAGKQKYGGNEGDESKSRPDFAHTEYEGDGEQLEEEAIDVCPLCISQLDEAIDEERLVEHLDVVMGLVDRLSSLNEDEEDIDQVIDAALQDLLVGDIQEEEE